MAKLTEVRLSANPEAEVAANPHGIGGKVNVSAGGKPYVQILIEEKTFGASKADLRTYWGLEDGSFKGFSPLEMKTQFEGKSLDDFGKFISHSVAPYTIKGSDGVERSVSKKTLFVFNHENDLAVFTSRGYSVTSVDSEGEVTVIASPKIRSNKETLPEQKADVKAEETIAA